MNLSFLLCPRGFSSLSDDCFEIEMEKPADIFVNNLFVVDPTVSEILDLMLGESTKSGGEKIRLYAQRLFPKSGRGRKLTAKLLQDMRTGKSSMTSTERLELLELFVNAYGD